VALFVTNAVLKYERITNGNDKHDSTDSNDGFRGDNCPRWTIARRWWFYGIPKKRKARVYRFAKLGKRELLMGTYAVTIVTRYKVEIENLEKSRRQISQDYEVATLPSIIPEDNIEYVDSHITYEQED
jgi:hypothetical protein